MLMEICLLLLTKSLKKTWNCQQLDIPVTNRVSIHGHLNCKSAKFLFEKFT